MKKRTNRLLKITATLIFISASLFLFIKKSDSQLFESYIYKKYFGTKSDAPHNVTCASCHLTHNSADAQLASVAGNANLCMSCHNPLGTASSLPFAVMDIANPGGGTGTSHAWGINAVNATYETNLPVNAKMAARIYSGNIVCSTCHDQHSQTFTPFLRDDNTGDALCKDCHSARDVGRYADDNTNHRGSHPVGLVYSGTGSLKAVPTGSLITIAGNIECSSCHMMHYSTSVDGNILRAANNNVLCTSCHTYGSHNGFSCNDCHQAHNTVKDNIYMIKDVVNGSTVNFYAETGNNSFGDEDAIYEGICEVCHTGTLTDYHRSDGTGASHNPGTNCTACHPHEDNFAPTGCTDCHIATFPGWGTTDDHFAHTSKYTFACNTCHLNYGSGGSLEPTHPSGGNANVNFNPFGLATRNGLDANAPTWNRPTCTNIYCHSDGISSQAKTGPGGWNLNTSAYTIPLLPNYKVIPPWNTGVVICGNCHLTRPTDAVDNGNHDRNPHKRECYWCHSTDNTTLYTGTYGTIYHVDGDAFFDARSYSIGGTIIDISGDSYEEGHCGSGRACWYP